MSSSASAVTVTTGTAVTVFADQFTSSATSVVGTITITESAANDITWPATQASGTIILTAPSGFEFATSPAPRISVNAGDIALIGTTATMTPTTILIAFSATSTVASTIHISTTTRIGVRPTAGTPLASGAIMRVGVNAGSATTSSGIVLDATNFTTLTETYGAPSQLVYTAQPSGAQTSGVAFTTQPVIALRDQYGNTQTGNSTSTVTLAAVLSSDGVTAGNGAVLAATNPVTVSAGVATFSNVRYTSADAIKLKATTNAKSSISSLSNAITFAGGATNPLQYADAPTPGTPIAMTRSIRWPFTASASYRPDTITLYEVVGGISLRRIDEVPGSATSVLETGLQPATTYANRVVRALTGSYFSDFSANFPAVTTLAATQPATATSTTSTVPVTPPTTTTSTLPMPTVSPSPSPMPSVTPAAPAPSPTPYPQPPAVSPAPGAAPALSDGDLVRASNDFRVYVIKHAGSRKFKRWIVSASIFSFYRHYGFAKVKVVDPAVLAEYMESQLIRAWGDQKVYVIRSAGPGRRADKVWVETAGDFLSAGFDWAAVYVVNSAERDWYRDGGKYRR